MQAIVVERVPQSPNHMILAYERSKRGGAQFSREYLITHGNIVVAQPTER